MTEIKEMIYLYDEYLMPILFGVVAILVVTLAISMIDRRFRFLKYLPGLVALLGGIVGLAMYYPSMFEHEYLNLMVLSAIAVGCGIISLAFALILGIVLKPSNSRESYIEYREY